MRALGIDTSTRAGSIGLWGDDGLSGEVDLRSGVTHSEKLLPAVSALLETAGLDVEGLDLLAVACGPGSFTGLRIGIATAAGLAMAATRPLLGFSTLETTALACMQSLPANDTATVCVLLDAGRGEVYRGVYRRAPDGAQPLLPDAAVAPQRAVERLPEGCVICGDGVAVLPEPVRSRLGEAGLLVASLSIGLMLAQRAVGHARLHGLQRLPPPLPIYLRPSDAEVSRRP
ncbi:MAG TPA: tRNA (adenosine(37)-N6)-threonylcarbamoyltransferase complex dimerization subunit type 1 TsaB [Candidatus Polarisedimenticolia bacterium]|nr:tRNA (adenosine(37)-N6)-threonylcarbamoyltransferase complex dimerization subunit type 1 TsaB [Candidatus Polarisedimenticolia bacterium]